jgi:hypothetical protein
LLTPCQLHALLVSLQLPQPVLQRGQAAFHLRRCLFWRRSGRRGLRLLVLCQVLHAQHAQSACKPADQTWWHAHVLEGP